MKKTMSVEKSDTVDGSEIRTLEVLSAMKEAEFSTEEVTVETKLEDVIYIKSVTDGQRESQ